LYNVGEPCNEMYFVLRGRIEEGHDLDDVVSQKIMFHYERGQTVGTFEFVFGLKHYLSARAYRSGVLCMALSRDDFFEVLKIHPNQKQIVMKNAMKDNGSKFAAHTVAKSTKSRGSRRSGQSGASRGTKASRGSKISKASNRSKISVRKAKGMGLADAKEMGVKLEMPGAGPQRSSKTSLEGEDKIHGEDASEEGSVIDSQNLEDDDDAQSAMSGQVRIISLNQITH